VFTTQNGMAEQNDTTTPDVVVSAPVPVIATMANMINYLTVSLYQGKFTHNDEQSWGDLNKIFDVVAKTPTTSPFSGHVRMFHSCVVSLKRVTETDDPDYHNYTRQLREYIAAAATAEEAAAAAASDDDDHDESWYNNDPIEDNIGDWELDYAQQELRDWTAEIRRNKRFDDD